MNPFTRETIVERRQPQARWGAVFAGAVVAVGLWLLLQVWGIGVGLSSISPSDAGSLKGAGIGTGVWSLISPLIAMFFGGLIGGWLAGTREKLVGGAHGAVVWALASIAGVVTTIWIVGMLVSGAARVTSTAVGAAGSAVSSGAGELGKVPGQLGVDANDLIGPINTRLREQGKPPITADQLEATVRGVAQRGLRQGKLDKELLVDEIARNTSLDRQDARDVVAQGGDRYDQLANQVSELGGKAERVALQAVDTTGKTLLWAGLSLLLSLAAAIGGGILGAARNEHARGRRRRAPEAPAEPAVEPPVVPGERTVITEPTA